MTRRSFALFALALAACNPPPSGGSMASAIPSQPPVPPASTPIVSKPPATPELLDFAKSNNAFALDVYGKLRAQKGNLAMSPFSLSTALLMTWAGARGETADQMRKVLHLSGAGDRPLEVAGSLIASYGDPESKVTLRVANRLFGDQSYTFDAGYLAKIRADFGAPLEPVDFKGNVEAGRARINGWVSKETNDRIKDLIPRGGIDATARLVLTNAIYFLGDWATPFEQSSTRAAPFSVTQEQKKDVPTMHGTDGFRFAAVGGAKVLEIPYRNGALAMTFVLPDAVEGLEALEAGLTPDALDQWTKALAPGRVNVSLPKFEIDPASSLSVGDVLVRLGMSRAFDPSSADFTGIANPPNAADRLAIGKVFHKAFVRVDEKGTEAAGASAVVMTVRGMAPQPPTAEFRADHPFLFLLRDTRSGAVLFMGRVNDPSSRS